MSKHAAPLAQIRKCEICHDRCHHAKTHPVMCDGINDVQGSFLQTSKMYLLI